MSLLARLGFGGGARAVEDHDTVPRMVQRPYAYPRDAKREMLETWATALAFYVGDQWRNWDERSRRLVKRTRIAS
jgi:hypothetical protein